MYPLPKNKKQIFSKEGENFLSPSLTVAQRNIWSLKRDMKKAIEPSSGKIMKMIKGTSRHPKELSWRWVQREETKVSQFRAFTFSEHLSNLFTGLWGLFMFIVVGFNKKFN